MSEGVSVRIYDRFGRKPVQIIGEVASVEWGLHEITEARVTIPITDDKLTEDLIRPGNMVWIQFENLDNWGGVLWTPIRWALDRVTLTFKSPHHYLYKRFPRKTVGKGMSPGALAMKLIRGAKKKDFLPIYTEEAFINTGKGKVRTGAQRDVPIFKTLNRLSHLGFEYWFNPRVINGELKFVFHWRPRREIKGDPIQVGEAGNAKWRNPAMVVTGEMVTTWIVIESDRLHQAGRRKIFETEKPHDEYGRWEGLIKVESIPKGDGKAFPALAKAVQDRGRPATRYYLDLEPGNLTKSVRIGSVHTLYGPDVGFTGGLQGTSTTVRITNMAYSQRQDYLEVIAEEYIGSEIDEWIP